jgi:hypothetical protein
MFVCVCVCACVCVEFGVRVCDYVGEDHLKHREAELRRIHVVVTTPDHDHGVEVSGNVLRIRCAFAITESCSIIDDACIG